MHGSEHGVMPQALSAAPSGVLCLLEDFTLLQDLEGGQGSRAGAGEVTEGLETLGEAMRSKNPLVVTEPPALAAVGCPPRGMAT